MTYLKYAIKIMVSIYVVGSLVACVNGPDYREYELDDEIIIESKDQESKPIVVTQADEEATANIEVEKTPVAQLEKPHKTFSSATGYWKSALTYLQHGDELEAKWALEAALKLDPANKIAKKLLFQIDADPILELGIINFEYHVQPGDSLSKVSQQFLQDPLQFYLLAKYNNIENPSHLRAGQVINIPGKKPMILQDQGIVIAGVQRAQSELAEVETSAEDVIDDVQPVVENNKSENHLLITAIAYFEENNYKNVIGTLEDSDVIEQNDPEAVKLLVSSYFENSKLYSREGNIQEAKYLLLKAAEIEPDNPKVNMALIDMDEPLETEVMYKEGIEALKDNRIVEAYKLMSQVVELNPFHKRALTKLDEIREQLVPHYYKLALLAQRNHKLDEAIEQWDEVLALDSSNENAKIYRSKAVSLKMKLEKFVAE